MRIKFDQFARLTTLLFCGLILVFLWFLREHLRLDTSDPLSGSPINALVCCLFATVALTLKALKRPFMVESFGIAICLVASFDILSWNGVLSAVRYVQFVDAIVSDELLNVRLLIMPPSLSMPALFMGIAIARTGASHKGSFVETFVLGLTVFAASLYPIWLEFLQTDGVGLDNEPYGYTYVNAYIALTGLALGIYGLSQATKTRQRLFIYALILVWLFAAVAVYAGFGVRFKAQDTAYASNRSVIFNGAIASIEGVARRLVALTTLYASEIQSEDDVPHVRSHIFQLLPLLPQQAMVFVTESPHKVKIKPGFIVNTRTGYNFKHGAGTCVTRADTSGLYTIACPTKQKSDSKWLVGILVAKDLPEFRQIEEIYGIENVTLGHRGTHGYFTDPLVRTIRLPGVNLAPDHGLTALYNVTGRGITYIDHSLMSGGLISLVVSALTLLILDFYFNTRQLLTHQLHVQDRLKVGLLLANSERKVIGANPEASRLLGLSASELKGMRLDSVKIKAIDEGFDQKNVPINTHAIQYGSVQIPCSMVVSDVPLPNGEPGALISLTDMQMVENQISTINDQLDLLDIILQSAGNPVICLDNDLNIAFANAAAAKFFDMPQGSLNGKAFLPLISPVGTNENRQLFAMLLSHGGNRAFNAQVLSSNGTQLPVHVTVTETGDGNKTTRFVLILRDSTLDIEQHQISQSEIKRLQGANEELADMNFVVHHDLREIVRIISLNAELLRNSIAEDLSTKNSGFFEAINRNIGLMDRLFESISEYSSVQRTRPPLEEVNVADIFEELSESINTSDLLPNLHITSTSDGSASLTNKRFVAKALEHVITATYNRADSSHDVDIALSARKNDDTVSIRIKDSEYGYPPEEQEEMFKPFRTSVLSKGGVFDNNLPLAQKIVEATGGSLYLDSSSPTGSVFVIELEAIRA